MVTATVALGYEPSKRNWSGSWAPGAAEVATGSMLILRPTSRTNQRVEYGGRAGEDAAPRWVKPPPWSTGASRSSMAPGSVRSVSSTERVAVGSGQPAQWSANSVKARGTCSSNPDGRSAWARAARSRQADTAIPG